MIDSATLIAAAKTSCESFVLPVSGVTVYVRECSVAQLLQLESQMAGKDRVDQLVFQISAYLCDENRKPIFSDVASAVSYIEVASPKDVRQIIEAGLRLNKIDVETAAKN